MPSPNTSASRLTATPPASAAAASGQPCALISQTQTYPPSPKNTMLPKLT